MNHFQFVSFKAINTVKRENASEQKVPFTESPIQIDSYFSLISILYNQNFLGFQLDRNGLKF